MIDPALEKVGGQLTPLTPCFRGLWYEIFDKQFGLATIAFVYDVGKIFVSDLGCIDCKKTSKRFYLSSVSIVA